MKRLLLTPFLLLLVGFGGKPTQWPTSWGEFDMPKFQSFGPGAWETPIEKSKPYRTVIFTDSIEEACKEFKKADNLHHLFWKRSSKIDDQLNDIWKDPSLELTYDERGQGEFVDPVVKKRETLLLDKLEELNVALWPRTLKQHSSAVEVLRQADYPDWKLYSRYDPYGVGDLWRKDKKRRKKEKDYTYNPNTKYKRVVREAKDVCKAFMP